MKFLFSHRNFPGQFLHILKELSKDPKNEIIFLTGTENKNFIQGVKKIVYYLKRKVPNNCHRYLRQFEESIIHGQGAAESAIKLKNSGFTPDVIYSHGWGNSLFFKDIFPNTPLINYSEWYYNATRSDIDFDKTMPDYDKKAMTRCNNSQFLQDLIASDIATSPTEWQKSQFPKIFHNKIKVIHDGIDTEYFKPDNNVVFEIPNTDVKLTKNDDVLTYATRGMEQYRGFPEFMETAKILLKKRENLNILIAGEDRVCYGPKPKNGTFKEIMLKKLAFTDNELKRLHFTGSLPYGKYLKLLQVSSAHIYLTYPFVLSWSFLEAMSTGCTIIASNTAPVAEMMKNNFNGYLVDFFDIPAIVKKVEYALDNKNSPEIIKIKENARKTIIEKYDLKKLLPRHIELIKNTANMDKQR